jgi:alkylresorcinol/alkylpyrone synthase
MGWNVEPQDLGVIFDRAIPPLAEAHTAPAIAGVLGRAGLGLTDIDRFACHPGGAKVVRGCSYQCFTFSRMPP